MSIQNPIKDPRWSVLQKKINAKKLLTILAKLYILNV